MTNKIVTEQQNNQKTYTLMYEDLFGPNIWYFIVYFTGL